MQKTAPRCYENSVIHNDVPKW